MQSFVNKLISSYLRVQAVRHRKHPMLSLEINLLKRTKARRVHPVDSLAETSGRSAWLTFRDSCNFSIERCSWRPAHLDGASALTSPPVTPPSDDRCLPSPSATTALWFLLAYANNCCVISVMALSSHSQQVIWGPKGHFVLPCMFRQRVILLFSDGTI